MRHVPASSVPPGLRNCETSPLRFEPQRVCTYLYGVGRESVFTPNFVELPNISLMRRTPSVLIPICRHRGLHARVSGSSSCIFEHLGLPADTPRSEVRRRYLEAALRTHPDHCLDADAATRMAVLQTAWESYRRSDARRRRTTSQTGGAPAEGFATFGVGCSFADSEQESAERAEIITMASRGMMNPRPLSESKCVTADTAAARHV